MDLVFFFMQRCIKVLPSWLNVLMDDIDEDSDMHTHKGKEVEEEYNGMVEELGDVESIKEEKSSSEEEEEHNQAEGEEEGGLWEREGSKVNTDGSETSESRNSSSFVGVEDTQYEVPLPDEVKDLPLIDAMDLPHVEPKVEETFDKFADLTLNIDVRQNEVMHSHVYHVLVWLHFVLMFTMFLFGCILCSCLRSSGFAQCYHAVFCILCSCLPCSHMQGVILEHRQKLAIRPAAKTHVVIDVSSPLGLSNDTRVTLKFTIQNGHITIDEEGGGRVVTTRANIAAAR